MSETSGSENEPIETAVIYKNEREEVLSVDPPMSEWSSLEQVVLQRNQKQYLKSKGLYNPGSGDICTKYIPLSDSEVLVHPYFKYPAVTDPGISSALFNPERSITYPEDGQELYLTICEEMNTCPVGIFYRNLVNDKINLSYYGVKPAGVRAMAIALQFNRHVSRLDLTDNFLDDDACFHLGQMLQSNVTLQELNLTGCRIGPSGMRRLGDQLIINRSLTTLNLARNCLSDEGGAILAKLIDDGATIPRLNLSSNNLAVKTAMGLAEGLEHGNKLTHLDLSRNSFLHIPSMVKLLERLANSEYLQELNLSWNSLEGVRVAVAVQKVLLVPTLVIIDLSNNRFHDDAIANLATSLSKSRNLRTLDLSYNPLTPTDAWTVLHTVLRPRVKIENLFLEKICVDKSFMDCLQRIRAMKSRKNFQVTHGEVLHPWTALGPDARELLLQRAHFLGNSKKTPVDVAMFFLRMNKEFEKPIATKVLLERLDAESIPLDPDFVIELSRVFAGPKKAKNTTVNLALVEDYIRRMWPEKKLPLTPAPGLSFQSQLKKV